MSLLIVPAPFAEPYASPPAPGRACKKKMPNQKTILAILSDLIFTVKIQDAAKRAGLLPVFARTAEDAMEKAKEKPVAIILDLNANSVEPLEMIAQLKSDEATNEISLLGFVSHVQGDLKLAAQQQGCDVVMARSAFSQNLQIIMKRYAEAADRPHA
jgi:PleD family two-component response regulator